MTFIAKLLVAGIFNTVLFCALLLGPFQSIVQAAVSTAITSDGTLGTDITFEFKQSGTVMNINGGTIKGTNQFHSFRQFSVGTGDTASFNGPNGILNILSRVTGGIQSQIDGTIKSTIPGANLYLMNPAGVLFGANAKLDLTGSFHVTTADYLRLADNVQFLAKPDVAKDAVLSTAPVAAFGFLSSSPRPITIAESILTVPTGLMLSLIGGDITITGGALGYQAAPGGQINIVGVASPGEGVVNAPGMPADFGMTSFSRLGRIQLRDLAYLDASGAVVGSQVIHNAQLAGGSVLIRGGRLVMDRSTIDSSTGNTDGARVGIDIQISGYASISGSGAFPVSLFSQSFGTGRAGDIQLNAGNLILNGSNISSATSGNGNAGTVTVSTRSLSMTRGATISSSSSGFGRGGNIAIQSNQITLTNGSTIETTAGRGQAGNVNVTADTLQIDGPNTSSFIFTEGGFPGNILLDVGQIVTSHHNVTLDGSLTGGGPLILTGPDYVIDSGLGQIRGSSLFHSFGLFGLLNGESATFTGPAAITNVLARVSGGQPSRIDGTLRVSIPSANLYLMNPAGVLFGPNAALDLSGSFHVTTADYLRLTDNVRFNAVPDVAKDSLLTAASVAAFGFLNPNPAAISVQASTLQVPNGQTLSVVGGDFTMTDGTLIAPSGQINLVSVGNPSATVGAEVVRSGSEETSVLTPTGFSSSGNILLANSMISTTGDPGGTIYIRGSNLTLDSGGIESITLGNKNGAALAVDIQVVGDLLLNNLGTILAGTRADGNTGVIEIIADSLYISGKNGGVLDDISNTSTGNISSNAGGRTGNGGNIDVKVRTLLLTDGASITNNTLGIGQAGNISITATESASILGTVYEDSEFGVQFVRTSGLSSQSFSGATSGRISILTPTLTLDAGLITAATREVGRAGDIVINVGTLTLRRSELTAFAGPKAESGNITITASEMISISNAGISVQSEFTGGNAGNISIFAPVLTMDSAGLSASTDSRPVPNFVPGNGGTISLQIGKLFLNNGSRIDTSTGRLDPFVDATGFGFGRAGDITITATESISMSGRSQSGFTNQILSLAKGEGAAGNITITTPVLRIEDGGVVATATAGAGRGGDINLVVRDISVTGGARIDASTQSNGPGGTVTLNATGLAFMSGSGPTQLIFDDRPFIGSSGVFTNTQSDGPGGSIELQSRQIQLTDGAVISAKSTGTGAAGNIFVKAAETLQLSNSSITTEALKADGGNITIQAGSLVRAGNSAITATVQGGSGNGGNITIDPQFVVLDHSQIIANAFGGNGGNISITSGVFLVDPSSLVKASSAFGLNGTIQIQSPVQNLSGTLSPLPSSLLKISPLTSACAARAQGGSMSSFTVAGRDGVPAEPGGLLPSPLPQAAIPSTPVPPIASAEPPLPLPLLISMNWEGHCVQ